MRREPLIFGGRLSAHELLGEPDVLRLEHGGYVAIDIRAAPGRHAPAPGDLRMQHGVPLALYTDILDRLGLAAGRYGFIWDAHRTQTRHDLDVSPGPRIPNLWEAYLRTRAALHGTLVAPRQSRPALCSDCKLCVWRSACYQRLKKAGDLTLLPELGRSRRDALAAEFTTLADLAIADPADYSHGDRTDFPRIGAQTLIRFQRLAALHVAHEPRPCLVRQVRWPDAPRLFLDIGTDPMRDFCYLHGFVIGGRDAAGDEAWRYESMFAADASRAAERDAFAAAMRLLRQHDDAVVVHYAGYGHDVYRRLAHRHPTVASREEIDALFAPSRAFDLHGAVRADSEWPTHDFTIGSLARCCGFCWRDADPAGALSVQWFDQWLSTSDPRLRQRLLNHIEDHCVAMRVVWDCMQQFPVRGDAWSAVPVAY
jgi:predicted RecB family nuclease